MKYEQSAILNTDSYKLGHGKMWPKGTTKVFSNFTPRNSEYFNQSGYEVDSVVWFGLQITICELKATWDETFFKRDKKEVIDEFMEFIVPFVGDCGFDRNQLEELHDVGFLPIEIRSLAEGTVSPIKVPVLTITNTVDSAFWLPNFLETFLSAELWKSCTSATTAAVYRKIIDSWADKTGGNKLFVGFQGHDFSLRGQTCMYDGAKSGAGHLLSFLGTDCLPAVKLVNDIYFGKETFVGCSVPASEHAVTTAAGKENELNQIKRFITELFPKGIVSCVADSYDFWYMITEGAKILKDDILGRQEDSMGFSKVVFRPDSGDPVKVVCGDPDASKGSPEEKGAVECLWEIFGGTINEKGYKTLSPRVGLIYGDSISVNRCDLILSKLEEKGFASDNIVFGIGSYTYQMKTRDSLGFAMKATWDIVNGEVFEIFKDPKTDSGMKKSAKGLVRVVRDSEGKLVLEDQVSMEDVVSEENQLKVVFRNGAFIKPEKFADMRERLKENIKNL